MIEQAGALHVGVVESVELDASGCIRVRIPALNGIFDCRVAMPLAGAGRGMVFLPEQADQVLLGSVSGSDVEFVLLGSLLSANVAPPGLDGALTNDTKLIQTRGGNLIRLMDTDGDESIEITTKNQQRIRFSAKDDSVEISTRDGGVKVCAKGDTISIKARAMTLDGDVHVRGELKVGVGGTTTIAGNKITGKS